jgi:hypothetical protein
MADTVNLRPVRKQKARAEKERIAEQNRAAHGRAKAERERSLLLSERAQRFVDSHRLESPDGSRENDEHQG